jgi:hypothetical protein
MSNWGVFEIDQERHVVPVINLGDIYVLSSPHILSRYCSCRPKNIQDIECIWPLLIWNHFDPTHPGAD